MSEQGTPRGKPVKAFLEDNAPWKPPAETPLHVVTAMQALEKGLADAYQQGQALKYIIETLAGTYEQQYRPGAEGQRDTDFGLGRRYVGLQIVKLLKLNAAALRRNDPNADKGEPQS